nr:piggyBac transposable element-derived protein 4-like [Onthophagus taurus]
MEPDECRRIQDLLQEVEEEELVSSEDEDSEVDEVQFSDHNSESELSEEEMPVVELHDGPTYKGRDNVTTWRKHQLPRNVRTRQQNIVIHLPGVRPIGQNSNTPKECFSLIFDDTMIETIVASTNIKIAKHSEKNKNDRSTYLTSITEMNALFGLLILSGLVKSGHQNLEDLWNVHQLGIDIFQTTMSLKRFKFLIRYMRFDDINTRHARRQEDKLAPIREIFERFNHNCKQVYTVSEYCTLDEQLVPFRGRCSFRMYIPSKPAKYGLKIFTLVDARTWYILKSEVYVGKQNDGSFKVSNTTVDVTMRLTEPIHRSGRNLTIDNWFTSFPLAELLLQQNVTMVGTMKKNKKELPPELLAKGRPEKSSVFAYQNNKTVVSYVPKKNKNVVLLSTMHLEDGTIDETTGEDSKPEIITFYNMTKGGVDVVDKLCSTYSTARKTNRWPLVLLFRILDLASVNSYVVFQGNNPQSKMNRKSFLQELGFTLVAQQVQTRATQMRLPKEIRQRAAKRAKMDNAIAPAVPPNPGQRSRCTVCPRKNDMKVKTTCFKCNKYMCNKHMKTVCEPCLAPAENTSSDSDY